MPTPAPGPDSLKICLISAGTAGRALLGRMPLSKAPSPESRISQQPPASEAQSPSPARGTSQREGACSPGGLMLQGLRTGRTHPLPAPRIRSGGKHPSPCLVIPSSCQLGSAGRRQRDPREELAGAGAAAGPARPLPPGRAPQAFYYFDILAQTHTSWHRTLPVCRVLRSGLSQPPRRREPRPLPQVTDQETEAQPQ